MGVRIHKGNTMADVREGIKKLHPGVNPAKMLFENAEMAEEDDVTEWATGTGSSDIRIKWALDAQSQKFWCWKPSGIKDLGNEELDGRSKEEIWRSLRRRNADLREFGEYRMFEGQSEVNCGPDTCSDGYPDH
jgi:hypothetical protein